MVWSGLGVILDPYSTKMILAVLDVSLIMGLNVGETDKVFLYINYNNATGLVVCVYCS